MRKNPTSNAAVLGGAMLAVTLLTTLGASDTAHAGAVAKMRSSLTNTGVDADAKGNIRGVFRTKKSRLQIAVSGLAPGSYSLVVGGIVEDSFSVDTNGSGKLDLKTGDDTPLDFDPRGEAVSINDGIDDILTTVFSAAGESADATSSIRVVLPRTADASAGKASARFENKRGKQKFKVEVEGVAAGVYDVLVGGTARAAVTVGAMGEGEIEFASSSDDADKLPLDFDPRGQIIDVAQGAVVLFSGALQVTATGVDTCTAEETNAAVASTGLDADASASARYRTRNDCEKDFSVEIEDIAVGSYDLFVAGQLRGQIVVTDDGTGPKGELEFESSSDDAGKLLLSFDPRGQAIEITQGSAVFFSGTFDGTAQPPTTCVDTNVELPLANSGVDSNGKGKVRYRLDDTCDADLRVEIEDVALGTYELWAGGELRGTFDVIDVAGENQGEIEFETSPSAGQLPLTFDPRGQNVEVQQGGVVFFSRALPAS
ncbi:MAG: hypothetical protein HY899_10320 [Deltaproteobacteria bacterium]|nr:hypothetical protein [Deltaproteobacteria bacterium]